VHLPSISPARLVRVPEPFDHPDWLFEMKYDGLRAMAYNHDGKAELISRKGSVYESFAPLRAQLATLGHDVILDGEITLLDQNGRPQFNDLLRKRGEPVFYVFDCLWLDGRDLRSLPFIVRKGILEGIIPAESPLLYARHVETGGVDLYRLACEQDMEGIVCKHKLSAYGSDELPWIKILNPNYSQRAKRLEFEKKRGSP
jgi:bifunctional non-homologous end joining protein LigD